MLAEVLEVLAPRDGGVYVDATFGAGGYTRALLEAAACSVVAIDRDPRAIEGGRALAEAHPQRLILACGLYSGMEEIVRAAGHGGADGVALDLGVSSLQLEEAARGFSFLREGPLDMRMGGVGPTAADLVNTLSEEELHAILRDYGEERRARAIARAIVRARQKKPIATTLDLAHVVESVLGPQRTGERIHPATRTFQALRMAVNDELAEVEAGLEAAERLLYPGGRLAVVSFHSLEDRLVKRFIALRSGHAARPSRHAPPGGEGPAPSLIDLLRGGRAARAEEIADNPRARSARLRAAERTAAPALATARSGGRAAC
jgi:16S rRNA (cytosine1402-N4)-methyltransferase